MGLGGAPEGGVRVGHPLVERVPDYLAETGGT
jgi:hypothetical protein